MSAERFPWQTAHLSLAEVDEAQRLRAKLIRHGLTVADKSELHRMERRRVLPFGEARGVAA